jgi:alpha,alpha-trehalase
MLETDPSFRPVRVRDGYPLLEDLGLIGDGATVALVGLDGSIHWLCLPRFDAEPVFCSLLDRERGGQFTIAPDELTEGRQHYQPDTGVLVTELRSPTGLVRLTDALALRSGADLTDDVPGGRGELVRSAVVLEGNVRLRVGLEPRGGAQTWMAASGLRLNPSRRPDLQLHLRSSRPLSGLHDTYDLKQGDSLDLVLSWGRSHRHHRFDAGAMLQATAAAWRRWMTHFSYEGLQEPLVRRAAITLKLCDHWVNGSLVAAPTSDTRPARHRGRIRPACDTYGGRIRRRKRRARHDHHRQHLHSLERRRGRSRPGGGSAAAGATFGFVEVLAVVDHEANQGEGDNEAVSEVAVRY